MYRSSREERPRRRSRSPAPRERYDDRSREYERVSRKSRSRSRDRGPSRRRGDRSRSRERGYDHAYGRSSESHREADYDQYAAFGGYGYAGYGMYPAAAQFGMPVPGLVGDPCYVCGGIGHIALDCPSRETLQRGRAGIPRISREREVEKCFECGKQGHQARECPFAKTVHENGAPVPRCYTCNAVGHIARDCPENAGLPRTRSPPVRRADRFSEDQRGREKSPRRERSPARGRSPLPPPPPGPPGARAAHGCYICHEQGHIARDCPERGGPRDPRAEEFLRSRGYGLGVGPGMVAPSMAYGGYRPALAPPRPRRGEATCYECGKVGHFGRECPIRLEAQGRRGDRREGRDGRDPRDERGPPIHDEDHKEALLNNDLEDYMKAKPAKDRDYENGYRGERDMSEGRDREGSVAASREGSSERKRDGSSEPRGRAQ